MQYTPSESSGPSFDGLGSAGQSLPLELYRVTCSYLSRRDLVQLLKTCRTLFNLVVPFVWYEVNLMTLLKLLPGCLSIRDDYDYREIGIEVFPPQPLPGDYFSRFHVYGRDVECLVFDTGYLITGTYSREPARTAILAALSSRILLPRLKSVDLSLICRFTDDDGSSRFWLEVLLPNTIRNLKVSISNKENLLYLEATLPKCSGLTQLNLNPPPYYAERNYFWEYIHTRFNTPESLEVLSVSNSTPLNEVLIWSSRMPKLRTLYLHAYDFENRDLSPFHTGDPPKPFQQLRYLNIRIYRDYKMWQAMNHIWDTLSISHLTRLKIWGDQLDPDFETAGHFLATVTAKSPSISDFSVEEFEPYPWQPFPFRHLMELRSLPLRKLVFQRLTNLETSKEQPMLKVVGNLWPDLEELDFSARTTGFEIHELLQIRDYLPNLRNLRVSFWSMDAVEEESALESNDSLLKHTSVSTHSPGNVFPRPNLTLKFNYMDSDEFRDYKCDFTYLDALIRCVRPITITDVAPS